MPVRAAVGLPPAPFDDNPFRSTPPVPAARREEPLLLPSPSETDSDGGVVLPVSPAPAPAPAPPLAVALRAPPRPDPTTRVLVLVSSSASSSVSTTTETETAAPENHNQSQSQNQSQNQNQSQSQSQSQSQETRPPGRRRSNAVSGPRPMLHFREPARAREGERVQIQYTRVPMGDVEDGVRGGVLGVVERGVGWRAEVRRVVEGGEVID